MGSIDRMVIEASVSDEHKDKLYEANVTGLKFFIFGNNISHSLSPTIHNTAFREFRLPHHYSIYQTPGIDDSIRAILQAKDFGGASVTFPHKLAIQPMLQDVTEAARKVGAVNTVVVRETSSGKELHGDNTDWLGILSCIREKGMKPNAAIVMGAGGAARAAVFAVQHLGLSSVTIVNRTRTTAENLASDFPAMNVRIEEFLSDASPADLIVGCVPADEIAEKDIPEHIFKETGLVIEMSYRPPISALMNVASRNDGWTVCNGVDVLKEQAYAQFELWTGQKAPRIAIEAAFS